MSCCGNEKQGGNIESGRISQVVGRSVGSVVGEQVCCIPRTTGAGGNTAGAALAASCAVRQAIVSDTAAAIAAARRGTICQRREQFITENARISAIHKKLVSPEDRFAHCYRIDQGSCWCLQPPPEYNNVGTGIPGPRFPCAPNIIGIQ